MPRALHFAAAAAAAAALHFAAVAVEAPAKPGERGTAISKLIVRLGSADWKAREEAAAELTRMGPAAVGQLRMALHYRDPEVRHRAEMILNRIAAKAAWNDAARQALAGKITLELSRAPLAKALRCFAEAAGVEVALSPHLAGVAAERKMLVTVSAHEHTASQVLLRMLKPRKLTYDLVYDSVVVEGGRDLTPALIQRELAKRVGPFEFDETPLRDAVSQLRAGLGVEVVFDARAFGEGGAPDKKVTLAVRRPVSAKSAFSLLLAGHDLRYVYDARRIIVTDRKGAKRDLAARNHDISRLAGHLHLVQGKADAEKMILAAVTECVDAVGWHRGNSVRLDGQALVVKAPAATQERLEGLLRRLEASAGVPEKETAPEEDFF